MSLKTYAEKRHFGETPEPAPSLSQGQASSQPQFCVQRHHASHLHYDFRLELGGALKSWAVPKGPTLDPNEKRLAMMVEDHPLDYGSFEGVIPKGNYGAGSVMLWDRGTYELLGTSSAEEQLARGDFKFRLHGEKLSGEFAIVRMKRGKGNEWLLIKKRDASASPGWDPEDHPISVLTGRMQEEIAKELEPLHVDRKLKARAPSKKAATVTMPNGARAGAIPKIVTPMLAEIGKGDLPSGDDWMYEIKWDGVRAICTVENGQLRITSRNGNAIDKQYPELAILPHHLHARDAVLDGEIAALDEKGRPSFELLQRRMHLTDAAVIARFARGSPVTLFLFDLLYLDGHDLRGVPLVERKKLLQEILTPSGPIRYSEHFAGAGAELLEAAKAQGLEGVVGKRADSTYEPRRSSTWQKWKVADSSDFIICGFTPGERDGLGALVLGEPDEDGLRWAGNVGTGFDGKMVTELREILTPLVIPNCPLKSEKGLPKVVTWVEPKLGCEVRFSNRTNDGRLRAPVFVRLRDDIDPPARMRTPLLGNDKETTLTIEGRTLKFTNLDKLYYPKDGYTKRDVLNYYDAVAPLILPHLKGRPLSLKRYPNGIEKQYFFQKNMPESTPKWVRTVLIEDNQMPVCDDRSTLLYLVNLGCIDHNPWMSRLGGETDGKEKKLRGAKKSLAGSLEHPDYVVIDLDPQKCGYDKIVEAALWVRARLEKAELESYPKTTGGDGMHIFIPLEPVYSYDQAKAFAEALATLSAAERPDLFTTPRSIARRENGKVYFDWLQIGEGKSISAPYVLRAYPGAPVATPLEWKEVTPRLRPEQFHLSNALARFDRVGDLFEGVLKRPQRLEKAVEKLV